MQQCRRFDIFCLKEEYCCEETEEMPRHWRNLASGSKSRDCGCCKHSSYSMIFINSSCSCSLSRKVKHCGTLLLLIELKLLPKLSFHPSILEITSASFEQ
jgi:hypothetical protein